jgi:hypothetical protein
MEGPRELHLVKHLPLMPRCQVAIACSRLDVPFFRYTGLAALALLGLLGDLPRHEDLINWCLNRQVGGFQGRPNKDEDTCYSFWIGASLSIIGAGDLTDSDAISCFAECCQGPKGGIAKQEGAYPDVLHSYFALSGLALVGMPGLRELDPMLGITCRARDHAGLATRAKAACLPCADVEPAIGYSFAQAAAVAVCNFDPKVDG